MDLYNELQEKIEELNQSIEQAKIKGVEYNNAEYEYKVKLRIEALKLKYDDNMPVTLINQIIYGVPEVAELRKARDIAETMYESAKEKTNTLKLQVRILDAQLQREYTNKYGV